MATTTKYGWPLPDGTSLPDVPYWFGQLGNAIANQFADSGWVDVTVLPGFTAMAGVEKPQCRKIGSVVYLRGGWLNTGMSASGTFSVGTLPDGFRPLTPTVGVAGSSTGAASGAALHIIQTGNIELRLTSSVGSYYKMDRQTFLVD